MSKSLLYFKILPNLINYLRFDYAEYNVQENINDKLVSTINVHIRQWKVTHHLQPIDNLICHTSSLTDLVRCLSGKSCKGGKLMLVLWP